MKPILFNTEMVQAILDGRKTVTRRVIKDLPKCNFLQLEINPEVCYDGNLNDTKTLEGLYATFETLEDYAIDFPMRKSPYKVGDILYVRETWCRLYALDEYEQIIEGTENYYYRADGYNPTPFNCFLNEYGEFDERACPKWKPSLHMPKEAARIFLKVTDVRVERLQDMKYFDYLKEGIPYKQYEKEIQADFIKLWDSTIKKQYLDKYSWNANPYALVFEFERTK